jgi:hypothetical protein
MVYEQEFHNPFAGFFHHRRIGFYHHPVGARQGAACLWLWRPRRNFDKAHAAIAGNGEALMVAKARYLNAQTLRRLDYHRSVFYFYFLSVYR